MWKRCCQLGKIRKALPLIQGNRAEFGEYETLFTGKCARWMNTPLAKYGETEVFPEHHRILPNFSTFYATTQCTQPDASLLGAMLRILFTTPYGEFNHFSKNVPHDRGAATNFLGKSWGM